MQYIWVFVVGHEQEGRGSNPFRPSSFLGRSHVERMFDVKYLLHTFHHFAVPLLLTCGKHLAAQKPFGWFVQYTSLTVGSSSNRELQDGDDA